MKLLVFGGGKRKKKKEERTTHKTKTYFNSNHPNIQNTLVEIVIIKKYDVAALEHTKQWSWTVIF